MSPVALDLADILGFSLPCTLHLAASLPKTQEVLPIVPEVKPFTVKKVIFKVTIIILTSREY
jgi:hypothetical protein